jgi:hypothetical protein
MVTIRDMFEVRETAQVERTLAKLMPLESMTKNEANGQLSATLVSGRKAVSA